MKTQLQTYLLLFLSFLFISSTGWAQDKLNDEAINDAVVEEFATDHAIDADKINIEINEGIVELTGKVSTLMAKERAARLAEMVRGVRSVSNRIEVDPLVFLSDFTIRQNVEGALFGDPATDSYEIDVSVADQVVILSGTVDSYQEKMLCEYVAKSAVGVRDLKNNIDVNFKTFRPDLVVEKEIRAALKWNIMVNDGLIDISVADGNVTLSGTVGSAAEKTNARMTAWVAGVHFINDDKLHVEPWAKDEDLRANKSGVEITDADIEQALIDAAAYDPRVFSYNIIPEVRNGWVTLRGTVDNLKAVKAAENLANHTYGVTGVTNDLAVATDKAWTDAAIRNKIIEALALNAITEAYEIGVKVDDGIVTLTGIVESHLEKQEAEWLTAGQFGVKEIVNELTVNRPSSYYLQGYYPYYSHNYPLYAFPLPEYDMNVYGITPDDKAIRNSIESQLWWSPFVNANQVNVSVEEGKATLTGTVDSRREYSAAIKNAWEGGALAVNSQLKISDQN